MRTLIHTPFCPGSRFVRLLLAEKNLSVRLFDATTDKGEALAQCNPAATTPVLLDEAPTGEEVSVSPAHVIADYLEEAYPANGFLPSTSAGRAEARRLVAWFMTKFDADVIAVGVAPHLAGAQLSGARPDRAELLASSRTAIEALSWHTDYLGWLLEQRDWLAGQRMSHADLAGAACLSLCDYFSLVRWESAPELKAWYARMKSRAAMREILAERLRQAPPPAHYADPDF